LAGVAFIRVSPYLHSLDVDMSAAAGY